MQNLYGVFFYIHVTLAFSDIRSLLSAPFLCYFLSMGPLSCFKTTNRTSKKGNKSEKVSESRVRR